MDERYMDVIKAAGMEKQVIPKNFIPAIVWNKAMVEHFDDSDYDFSKVTF